MRQIQHSNVTNTTLKFSAVATCADKYLCSYNSPTQRSKPDPYLIFVSTAQPAVVYFFQAGVPFPRKNAEGTALAKFIHTPFPIKNITNTASQCQRHQVRQPKFKVCQPNTKYANQNPCTPTKISSTPTKNLRCFVARKILSP